jgi:mono/diheme cytochrome c family protein
MNPSTIRWMQYGAILLIATVALGAATLSTSTLPAHALPEFSDRTGESCSTCHVSPGGGGPRTLRGLLWTARGRPDEVPVLANMLIAPNVDNGTDLYEIACVACHGVKGEGLFGTALANTSLRKSKISSSIKRGRKRSGMPSFKGQFTDEQLDTLAEYVAGLAKGKIEPPPDSYPLPPGELSCDSGAAVDNCGGN